MRIAPLVTFIFTSSLLSGSAASILCRWTKVSPNGKMHYSFLHSDSRESSSSLRLYHAAWTEERALLGCTWSEDAAVTQNYLSLCRERAQGFSDHPNENVDLDSVFGTEGQCVSLASLGERTERRSVRSIGGQCQDERSEVSMHQRVKRGFIVPGTLWCGSGNKAPSYSDLGMCLPSGMKPELYLIFPVIFFALVDLVPTTFYDGHKYNFLNNFSQSLETNEMRLKWCNICDNLLIFFCCKERMKQC